jgi:hypothetical protein
VPGRGLLANFSFDIRLVDYALEHGTFGMPETSMRGSGELADDDIPQLERLAARVAHGTIPGVS